MSNTRVSERARTVKKAKHDADRSVEAPRRYGNGQLVRAGGVHNFPYGPSRRGAKPIMVRLRDEHPDYARRARRVVSDYDAMSRDELRKIARERKIKYSRYNKAELVEVLKESNA